MATDKMDRGLDEIIADTRSSAPRGRRGGRRRERPEGPRDGIRKSYRDEPRNLDSEWVHDRYEDNNNNYRRGPAPRRQRESPDNETSGTKIRVENIHYDLTEEDLDELFQRIGPVTRLQLRYDRAGRSEGVAFVTYESKADAEDAIRQFDGANANGQPIRLTFASGRGSRNPFDTAVMPGRPLSERISAPGGRARSHSPSSRYTQEDAERKGIDRYVPGQDGRSRTPPPPRRRGPGAGRRPGARRERGDENGGARGGGGGGRGNPRSKKTQEELDAEMADYFGGGADAATEEANGPAGPAAAGENGQSAPAPVAAAGVDDIDMIE